MDSCRWLLLRDMAVFRPDHHRMVVCQRDTELEILEGHKERRNKFVVDSFSGLSWGRLGSGVYTKWSTIPPAGMMQKTSTHRPKPDKHVVICCLVPQYSGVKIGRIHADNSDLYWQVFSDLSNDWVAIPASYIEGWLDLP